MNKNFIIVSYWWGKYKTLSQQFSKMCTQFNLEHDIQHMEHFKTNNYQLNINYKPQFIKTMLLKHKKPVVYLDMDMKIKMYPELFDFFSKKNIDFSAFNWNSDTRVISNFDPFTLETSGGIMYFGYTKNAFKLLNLWSNKINLVKYKKCADDRLLAMVFYESKAINWCSCFWLPFEYIYIPDYFKNVINEKNVVIMHNSNITSEEKATKKGASVDRVPKDYNIDEKVKTHKCLYINDTVRNIKHMKYLIKDLKQKYPNFFKSNCKNVYKILLKS